MTNNPKPQKRKRQNSPESAQTGSSAKHASVKSVPTPHQHFLETSVPSLEKDPRILGIAAGGSYLFNALDEFSDLDLVLYIQPVFYPQVLADRQAIASKMGSLIECFTGEHVGEPRLLICLFGPPLLHVDLKFVSMDDIQNKVEDPILLWEREGQVSRELSQTKAHFPLPDHTWIEKRFWIWVHYTATKIGRGELFESLESIGFLRSMVLGPLLLQKNKARPQGLRKIERNTSPGELEGLKGTLAEYNPESCITALYQTIDLYRSLRSPGSSSPAEKPARDYLDQIAERINHGTP